LASRRTHQIGQFGKSIFNHGPTASKSGSISVKLSDGWIMTPPNGSLDDPDSPAMSRLDVAGKLMSGKEPIKDAFFHRDVRDE
jgi:ribulose-5-phosphate 4-epimerase/fuculose-1-phosphate aldolase